MGIVNAGQLAIGEDIDTELRELVEDVILNRRDDATERLVDIAPKYNVDKEEDNTTVAEWRSGTCEERLAYGLIKGIDTFVVEDIGSATERNASTGGDRGAPDGGNEHRR